MEIIWQRSIYKARKEFGKYSEAAIPQARERHDLSYCVRASMSYRCDGVGKMENHLYIALLVW